MAPFSGKAAAKTRELAESSSDIEDPLGLGGVPDVRAQEGPPERVSCVDESHKRDVWRVPNNFLPGI